MRADLMRLGQFTAVQSALALRTLNKDALGPDGLFLVILLSVDLRFVSAKPGH